MPDIPDNLPVWLLAVLLILNFFKDEIKNFASSFRKGLEQDQVYNQELEKAEFEGIQGDRALERSALTDINAELIRMLHRKDDAIENEMADTLRELKKAIIYYGKVQDRAIVQLDKRIEELARKTQKLSEMINVLARVVAKVYQKNG